MNNDEIVIAKYDDFSNNQMLYLYCLFTEEFNQSYHYPDEHDDWEEVGAPTWEEIKIVLRSRKLL